MPRESSNRLCIGGREVGQGAPLFVIAEIGLNHDGDVERALALVDAAAAAGAAAVKLQTVTASALVARDAPAPAHVAAASMVDFFRRYELDEPAHRRIVERARARGLAVIATALSEDAVGMLERVGVDGYKIASGDVTWEGLVRRCAATGKPLILSSGMSSMVDVRRAILWARRGGAGGVAVLHCVSAYPVPRGSENLRAIATLGRACDAVVGLSDHGADGFAAPLAVALGASIYERHLILAEGDGSIDAAVSSTPDELHAIVRAAVRAGDALGSGTKTCLPAERPNLEASRRSLYARHALPAGHVVGPDDLIALRPAVGLTPDRQRDLIGQRLQRRIDGGAPFLVSDLTMHAKGIEHVA